MSQSSILIDSLSSTYWEEKKKKEKAKHKKEKRND
jgi:hypothetical protein